MLRTQKKSVQVQQPLHLRAKISLFAIYSLLFIISLRLFYWQIVKGSTLSEQADNQYTRSSITTGLRGSISTADGYTLVTNKQVFTLFAQPHRLAVSPEQVAEQLTPLLLTELDSYQAATQSAQKEEIAKSFEEQLKEKLEKDTKWISLKTNVSEHTKKIIDELAIVGLGFDPYLKRDYPEASMAAHVTGFVGKDAQGEDIGYFGVEGAMDKELKARTQHRTYIADALGLQLSGNQIADQQLIDGRSVTLTLRRDIQNIIESELKKAVEKYGAKSGEIIVLEPKTGKILGLAAYPYYDQEKFYEYDPSSHKNPTLSDLYEPGSTFKIVTVAAGIEEGAITPETVCDTCSGPKQYGKYTIRTWNDEYHPNTTMEEGLANSDNIAMIFIAEKLGIDTFKEYLEKFGVGQKLSVDLQEDRDTPFPTQWGDVKLATTSFGQGLVVNTLQVVRATATIANGGVMMRPYIVESVKNTATGEIIQHTPIEEKRVVSTQTAEQVTKMLITAAQHGEAQWIASQKYVVAGKTGTSQVVTEKGYDSEKTIATFVGFAPPEDPKFVMITKLNEPQSSPWAAETAAPLWHAVAQKLFLLLNIQPSLGYNDTKEVSYD